MRCRRALPDEYSQHEGARNGLLQRLDLAHAHSDRKTVVFAKYAIRRTSSLFLSALDDGARCALQIRHYFSVPPTVISRILIVGRPTLTGMVCPSFPQIPMPCSSFKSFPTAVTSRNTVGPLPINVAPLTGAVRWPSSIKYASLAENTNFP